MKLDLLHVIKMNGFAGVIAAGALVTGCTTVKPKITVIPPEVELPSYESYSFAGDSSDAVSVVHNAHDVKEVIGMAKYLSDKKRHEDAAAIYEDASKRFKSEDGRFEKDCLLQAAVEYWNAGQVSKTRELLNRVEKQYDLYGRTGEDESLRALRELLNG